MGWIGGSLLEAVVGHDVQRLSVACGPVTLAAELHTLGPPGRPLVCFVPGGTIDPRRERPITSAWEREQLSALAGADCDGLTMNFPGVGSSGGELADNTLRRRRRWIEQLLETAVPRAGRGPLVLVGCSMGAHVAALLAETLDVRALALVAPAAYGADAEDAPFGPSLSASIRRPGAWRESPAFAAIRRYRGPVLLLLPEHDEVIPPGVASAYAQAAGPRAQVVSLPAATHRMLSSSRPPDVAARSEICRRIAQLASRAQRSSVVDLGAR